jgi:ubiquinone/menaquinone biosynthesis C-methylase UbiE
VQSNDVERFTTKERRIEQVGGDNIARPKSFAVVPVEFSSQELAAKYNRFARWYDYCESVLGFLGLRRLRQSVVSQTSGKVLEVAVGTGQNFRHYRSDCEVIALDHSSGMLKIARQRASTLNFKVQFCIADAEALPFHDYSFDTVVSSLSTCTFPNPATALYEMGRVGKPSGHILLLEHGRSDRQWLGGWQDRHADKVANQFGCHWNREPLALAKVAGLKMIRSHRNFFGIFHRIRAKPDAPGRDDNVNRTEI